ncbi:parathyroid hormone-related protein-like isoform X1 [Salmo salar]|uniref:Parathyroid hormone-related protein-like isoform X1 n=3 Tax=Salmo TaxID=8028 RepID=A0A1S3KRW0_SALSA|nr:parathyroid hormone-related protein-like isoform X1 [Salmo salar]|eukprot:XP_013981330.1 PREDICTED: parathyroid hormone-related protein-like isoform X1 [Salmo salar]
MEHCLLRVLEFQTSDSRMLCSRGMLQQWSLAVFLLYSSVPLYGRPIDALTNRMRRSVSHAQLMHDKGRSLHEFKRRHWIQELLDQVHTSDSERAPAPQSRTNECHSTFSGSALSPPKPSGGTKNLPLSFRLGGEGSNLPQETNKSVAYKHQPLKVVTKRKKKVKGERGRRKESEKRRRRARSVVTSLTTQREELQRTQDTG